MVLSFLKPTLPKIITAGVLLGVTYVLQASWWNANFADYWAYGFPFPFYETWGPCEIDAVCRAFRWPRLLLDVAIWYLLAAVVFGSAKIIWGRAEE